MITVFDHGVNDYSDFIKEIIPILNSVKPHEISLSTYDPTFQSKCIPKIISALQTQNTPNVGISFINDNNNLTVNIEGILVKSNEYAWYVLKSFLNWQQSQISIDEFYPLIQVYLGLPFTVLVLSSMSRFDLLEDLLSRENFCEKETIVQGMKHVFIDYDLGKTRHDFVTQRNAIILLSNFFGEKDFHLAQRIIPSMHKCHVQLIFNSSKFGINIRTKRRQIINKHLLNSNGYDQSFLDFIGSIY